MNITKDDLETARKCIEQINPESEMVEEIDEKLEDMEKYTRNGFIISENFQEQITDPLQLLKDLDECTYIYTVLENHSDEWTNVGGFGNAIYLHHNSGYGILNGTINKYDLIKPYQMRKMGVVRERVHNIMNY